MNRINRKLLLISLAVIAILGLGLFLVNRYQVSRYGDFHLARAREARDAGKYVEAVGQYRQAINQGKRSFETHSELAQALFKLPDPEASHIEGLVAEQFRSDSAENHRLLAESALLLRRFSDAQRWADRFLESFPQDTAMLILRARARALGKEYQLAIEDYEAATQHPDAPVAATVELASIYTDLLNEFKKGREVIDRLVTKDDGGVDRFVEHGAWYLDFYSKQTLLGLNSPWEDDADRFLAIAIEDAKLAMSQYPDEPSGYVLAMRAAIASRDFQRALAIGESVLAKFPKARELYAFSAFAAKEGGDTNKATETLRKGLQQIPNDQELLWEQAELQLSLRDFEQGRKTIKRLQTTEIPKPKIDYLEGRYLAAEGEIDDAIKLFEGLRAKLVDLPNLEKVIDLELAQCYESIGDRAGQIQVLRRAASKDSSWIVAREQLALALLAVGRIDEATAEYMIIADPKNAPIGVKLNLVRLLVRQNVSKESSKQNWAEVNKLLEEVENAVGNQPELAVARAESLLAQDRVDDARQVLFTLPPTEASFVARILLEVDQQAWEQADQLIEESKQAGIDGVGLRRSRGVRAVIGNDPNMEQTLESLVTVPESWPVSHVMELDKELLPIALSAELLELTERLANRILGIDPANILGWFAILDVQLRREDGAAMQETLTKIEKITGRNAIWNYGQALARVVDKDAREQELDRAQQFLDQAALLRPDWADVPALSGTLYDRQGKTDAAIPEYERAIELGWRRFEEAKRLLDLLMERGRYLEADAVIRRLSQSSPTLSSSMSTEASKVSFRLGNLQRAVEKAEEAAKVSSKASDLVWLSRVKLINKDNIGAEQALRRAMELDGSDPTVQFAWIDFLRRNARMDEARNAALVLESQIADPSPLQLLQLAEIYRILGMAEDKNRTIASIDSSSLRSLAELQGYFPFLYDKSSQTRIDYLERLINTDGSTDVIPWARRQLAIEYMSRTEDRNYAKARQLLAENLKADSKSREDRKTMAMISAVEKGNLDPSESLAIFEQLLREGWNPNPDEQFILGQLFIAKGDWTQGSSYFLQLANRTEDRNPDHIKTYVKLLLRRKDAREAELWLDVLQRDGVKDAETAELLADVRFYRGQYKDLLQDLVGTNLANPETELFVATLSLRRRFELLNNYLTLLTTNPTEDKNETEKRNEAATRFAEEVERMKSSLESSSDFPGMYYAEQLLARGDFDNAISAFERTIQTSTPEEMVAFADRFLVSQDVPTAQIERLEKLFVDANREKNASVFRVVIARLKEMRGEFDGAENVYREVLKDNSKDSIVLNNLANLLALKGQKLDEALAMINQSIEIEGETANFLDTRGVVHLKAGKIAEAVKDLKEAVRQFPHPLLRYHLAWALYESRQFADAKVELRNALNTGLQKSMTHILEREKYDKLMKELMKEEM